MPWTSKTLDLVAGEAHLREAKGGAFQTVYLAPDVVRLLERELAGRTAGPVFTAQGGTRLTTRHVQRRFELWRERAGLHRRYSPHSLRHTFAMGLYERTGDVLLVQAALGHRSIGSTMVYARAGADRVRAAVVG